MAWTLNLEPFLAAVDAGRLPDAAAAAAALRAATAAARDQMLCAARVQCAAVAHSVASENDLAALRRAARRAADAARALDLLRPAERALLRGDADDDGDDGGADGAGDWRRLLPSLAAWRRPRAAAWDDGFDAADDLDGDGDDAL